MLQPHAPNRGGWKSRAGWTRRHRLAEWTMAWRLTRGASDRVSWLSRRTAAVAVRACRDAPDARLGVRRPARVRRPRAERTYATRGSVGHGGGTRRTRALGDRGPGRGVARA